MERGRPWRERAPLERGALSLQTSLSPENFPQEHPPLYGENLFRYVWAGALGESFFVFGEVFLYGAAIAPVLCVGRIWRIYFAWISYPTALPPPIGCDSRTLQKFPPPAQTKTSPQDPHHQKGETKLRSSHGGGLVGKFGEVEGGLEGEGTPSERGFLLPPRSFHPLPPPRQPQNETVEEEEERGENESNHQNRGNRADAEQKSHR